MITKIPLCYVLFMYLKHVNTLNLKNIMRMKTGEPLPSGRTEIVGVDNGKPKKRQDQRPLSFSFSDLVIILSVGTPGGTDRSFIRIPSTDKWCPFHKTSLEHCILLHVNCSVKVTRPSFFGGVPSYFEALWYPHLYFYRKSNT